MMDHDYIEKRRAYYLAVNMPEMASLMDEIEAEELRKATPATLPLAIPDPLMPKTWEEFIGQEPAKREWKLEVDAAMRDGRPPKHPLFYGPAGTGKCLEGNTLISFQRSGIHKIKRFDPGKDGFSTFNQRGGNGRLIASNDGWKNVSSVFRETAHQTIKIITHLGFSLEGTPEHPILSRLGWKKLGELSKGDIVIIQPLPMRTKKGYIPLLVDGKFSWSPNKGLAPTLSPKVGRLLGYLVADAWCGELDKCSFTNSNPSVVKDFTNLVKACTGKTPTWDSKHGGNYVRFSDKRIRSWLLSAGLTEELSANKEIPEAILRSPREVIREFLRSYLECETYIGDSSIEFTSASQKLAQQVHILLLSFGIIGRLVTKPVANYGDYYRVTILGRDNYLRYAENLFPVSESQKNAMGLLLLQSVQPQTNRPEPFDWTDTVESIEYRNESLVVYDFTIPENHCFLSNGFVSHNSALVFLTGNVMGLGVYESTGSEFNGPDTVLDTLERIIQNYQQTVLWLLDEIDGMKLSATQILHQWMLYGYVTEGGQRWGGVPIVICGTTNYISGVPRALRSRFSRLIKVGYYSPEELACIAKQNCHKAGVEISEGAAQLLGEYSGGEPRRLNKRLLEMVFNLRPKGPIDEGLVKEVVKMMGLFPLGLTTVQVEYLQLLAEAKNNKLGKLALASALQEDPKDVELEHEGWLRYLRLITTEQGGRVLTEKGKKYLEGGIE